MNHYMTSAEKLIMEQIRLEGKLQGWQDGWARGWEESAKRTQYEIINMLVKHKYGTEPAALYEERMKSATSIEVQKWGKKLITCPTIEALFL